MSRLQTTAQRLARSSVAHASDPHTAVNWPENVDHSAWFVSENMVSLCGTSEWERLDLAARRRVSFWDAVNFFSLCVHGERVLIEGVAQRMAQPGTVMVREYLHHFLTEENNHSLWFATFCDRYGDGVLPERKVAFPRQFADGEEDVLFFAQAVIFEEIVDARNAVMARDETLHPLSRRINALHHADEARHLLFGRRMIEDLWQHWVTQWDQEVTNRVRAELEGYVQATWRTFYNPVAYAKAGVQDPVTVARLAWSAQYQQDLRLSHSSGCLAVLHALGVHVR